MERETYEQLLNLAQKKFDKMFEGQIGAPSHVFRKYFLPAIDEMCGTGQSIIELGKENRDTFEARYVNHGFAMQELDTTKDAQLFDAILKPADFQLATATEQIDFEDFMKAQKLAQVELIQKVITDNLKLQALHRVEATPYRNSDFSTCRTDLYASILNNLLEGEKMLVVLNKTRERVEDSIKEKENLHFERHNTFIYDESPDDRKPGCSWDAGPGYCERY